MNREIKFRIWDYQQNKWATDADVKESIGLEFGVNDYYMNIAGERMARWSFMQYTGLKDKNGKEIYEGDILKSNYSLPLIVVFEDGKFCFYNNNSSGSDVLSQMRVEKLYVIGNIHDNQDLLQ